MLGLSWYLVTLFPAVLQSSSYRESGSAAFDATLLTKVTINYADNAVDNSRDTKTESNVEVVAQKTGIGCGDGEEALITYTPKAAGITLAHPPWLPNHFRFAMGPFFEDGPQPYNVTSKLGTTALLDCKIGLLYDKTVSWVRRRGDTMHLLTVGRTTYSVDQRITLSFRYPNNWRLQITSVTRRDDGLYECQIATHPTTVKKIFLRVLAPEVSILDEKGRQVTERYYKAGSTIRLACLVKQAEGNPADSIIWSRSKPLSTGITTNSSTGIITSNLKISKAQNHHSGKYTCTVDQLATASVTLHILNGKSNLIA